MLSITVDKRNLVVLERQQSGTMSFHFINIATPQQGISPEVRAHVMRDFMKRKVSRTDHDGRLNQQAKRNQTGSLRGKLYMRDVSEDRMKLPDKSCNFPRFAISREDSVVGAITLVANASRHSPLPTTTSASGPAEDFRSIDSSRRDTDEGYPVSINDRRLQERIGKRYNDRVILYLLEMMRPFTTISPPKCIGSQIDPFHTLPQLPNTQINIENMKKHCE